MAQGLESILHLLHYYNMKNFRRTSLRHKIVLVSSYIVITGETDLIQRIDIMKKPIIVYINTFVKDFI